MCLRFTCKFPQNTKYQDARQIQDYQKSRTQASNNNCHQVQYKDESMVPAARPILACPFLSPLISGTGEKTSVSERISTKNRPPAQVESRCVVLAIARQRVLCQSHIPQVQKLTRYADGHLITSKCFCKVYCLE